MIPKTRQMMTLECKMITPISTSTFKKASKDNHRPGRKIKQVIDLRGQSSSNLFIIYMVEQVIQVQQNPLNHLAPTIKLQIKAEAHQANNWDKTNIMIANI